MKNYLLVTTSIMLLSITPFSFAAERTYDLEFDEKTFDISYSLDGEVLAMEIDPHVTSLLVGTENVEASIFTISFPSELLRVENADFIILVDGLETAYTLEYEGDNTSMTFPIPAFTEEIEIIGTHVIPEFPLGVLAVMGVLSATVIALSRTRLSLFR